MQDDPVVWDGRIVIETERLRLRGFTRADLPAIAAMHADLEVMQYLGGARIGPEITDGIAAAAQRSFAASGIGKLAVERRADGALIGMCGLSVESWYPDDLEVGWRLARAYWGHGYASEAGAAWVDHAFAVLGAKRVLSVADAPNLRSIAVMQRLGFTFDHAAELSDEYGSFSAVIYAIDAAGWRSRRNR